ncbi:hypothetical protein MMC12_005442 [Toensbergia leucococca]|nr:hypothetical protein [Toensbergia leucococca]
MALVEQIIPEDTPNMFHELVHELDGSVTAMCLAELPAEDLVASTSSKEKSLAVESSNKRSGQEQGDLPHMVTEALPTDATDRSPRRHDQDSSIATSNLRLDGCDFPTTWEKVEYDVLPSFRPGIRGISSPPLSFPLMDVGIPPKPTHPSNSSSDSLYSQESSPRPEDYREAPETGYTSSSSQSLWKAQPLSFSLLDLAALLKNASEPRLRLAASSEDLPNNGKRDIYAPIPERCTSSQSHRDRLSRMLSIDEGLIKLPEPVLISHEIDELCTRDKSIDSGEDVDPGSEHACTLLSVPYSEISEKSPAIEPVTPKSKGKQETVVRRKPIKSVKPPKQSSEAGPVAGLRDIATNGVLHNLTIPRRSSSMRKTSLHLFESSWERLEPILAADETDPRCLSNYARPSTDPGKNPPQLMKRLPLLPKDPSHIDFSPPYDPMPKESPLSFAPLITSEGDRPPIAELENTERSISKENEIGGTEVQIPAKKYKLKMRTDRESIASPPGSRPWNLDASYRWTDQPPDIGVIVPKATEHPQRSALTLPRFKLKITRASTSTAGTTKITKQLPSVPNSPRRRTDIPSDLFKAGPFARKRKSIISTSESHKSLSGTRQTRFVEIVDRSSHANPIISLQPPSPGMNHSEVRSFFSDDSSQMRHRGSLRKRLSDLKAIASRVSTSDDAKGDRARMGSAMGRSRASGRSSQGGGSTILGVSNLKYVKTRCVQKVKGWWQRGEEKVRSLGGRIKPRSTKNRSASADLYVGV